MRRNRSFAQRFTLPLALVLASALAACGEQPIVDSVSEPYDDERFALEDGGTENPPELDAGTEIPPVVITPPAAPLKKSRRIGENSFARGGLNRRPWIVMVDNHKNAYPQYGLDQASILFEALAEGGITRYMGFFQDGLSPELPVIGPTRSTRLYFAQWAMGYRALYPHAGGSPDGNALAESTPHLVNLELTTANAPAWRDPMRKSPHNLMTNSALLRKYAEDHQATDLVDAETGYRFDSYFPTIPPVVGNISYKFHALGSYVVSWTYDTTTNSYLRFRYGTPHTDAATGLQLRTKNVVVMESLVTPRVGDASLRIDYANIGTGPAAFFIAGGRIDGTWQKLTAEAPLLFFDSTGTEIEFNLGQLAIAVIPSLSLLTAQ